MRALRKSLIINKDYIMIINSILSNHSIKSLKKHKTLLSIMETSYTILITINPNSSSKLIKSFKMDV